MTFRQIPQCICLTLLPYSGYEAVVSILVGLFHVFQENWVVINGDDL